MGRGYKIDPLGNTLKIVHTGTPWGVTQQRMILAMFQLNLDKELFVGCWVARAAWGSWRPLGDPQADGG